MDYRQQQFISHVVKMANGDNRALLEAVVKGYIVNEGITDWAKKGLNAMANGAKSLKSKVFGDKVTPTKINVYENRPTAAPKKFDPNNLTPEQQEAKQKLIIIDQRTWAHDYQRFLQAQDDVTYFLNNYGNREFNQIRGSEEFKKAERRGKLMDTYIRPNPLKTSDGRQMAFRAFMDSIMTVTNKTLVESIMEIYNITESVTTVIPLALMESSNRDYAVSQLKEDMAAIQTFISRHGTYPWEKYIQSKEFKDAFAMSAKNNPSLERPSQIDPSMVKTVKGAYNASYANAVDNF